MDRHQWMDRPMGGDGRPVPRHDRQRGEAGSTGGLAGARCDTRRCEQSRAHPFLTPRGRHPPLRKPPPPTVSVIDR
jgi:hypothetical protein